jgi:negative regulator of sigma E activity
MTTDRPTTDDLETLSALFDGALDDDAARFARKRLGHDMQWQQACGRWQLIGDALRGQATAAAPADFAQRVHDAVAGEPVPALVAEPAPAARAAKPAARRAPIWIGGALAASVAAVAVFVGRPVVEAPAIDPAPMLVVAPSVTAPVVPASAAAPTALASNVDAAPPRSERRTPRARQAVFAARETTDRIARDVQRSVEADARVAEAAPDPFRPATEIVTRPWPRAVLPNSQAAGALTASFESPGAGARSFYPFEPPADVPASRDP